MTRIVLGNKKNSNTEKYIVKVLMANKSGYPGMKGHKRRVKIIHPLILENCSEVE